MTGISDNVKLVRMIYRFLAFVRLKDGEGVPLSFQDKTSFLGSGENYKSDIFKNAQDALQCEKWTEDWINDGRILACARKAVKRCGNLINKHQKTGFMNITDPTNKDFNPEAAQVLYHIYKSKRTTDVKAAFIEATKVFGRKYDTISYLFFIKDQSKFLPVRPESFENSLSSVGYGCELSGRCSWETYNDFIKDVREIRDVMREILPDADIRLIDAHTFLWVIHEDKDGRVDKQYTEFLTWEPDAETAAWIEEEVEGYLQQKATGSGGRRDSGSPGFKHSAEVVRITRARAKGVCELCGKPAPFKYKKGEPYLEAHHIVWLSRDGADDTDNTAALCPNCHTKMHVVDDEADAEKLMSLRSR